MDIFYDQLGRLKQPCTSCEAPYGFRNHMTLSTNTSQFSVSLLIVLILQLIYFPNICMAFKHYYFLRSKCIYSSQY